MQQQTFGFYEPPPKKTVRRKLDREPGPLGFRVTRDRKRIVIRRPGQRRQASPEEIALWNALKEEKRERKRAQQKATDLDCALAWIENLRETRRHATETIGRASQVTKLAEEIVTLARRTARLIGPENIGQQRKLRQLSSNLSAALGEHIVAAEKAKTELGIGEIHNDRRFRNSNPSADLSYAG